MDGSGLFMAACVYLSWMVNLIKGNPYWGWATLCITIIIDHWIEHFVTILEKW